MPEPAESPRDRESAASRREPRLAQAEETEQLVLTISSPTRHLVKIEKVDKGGKREELSDEQAAELVGDDDEMEEIEAGLEEAFEAGVAAFLGGDDEDVDDGESAIQRLLIGRLVGRHPGLRGLRRQFLRRLLLRRLLRGKLLQRRVRR